MITLLLGASLATAAPRIDEPLQTGEHRPADAAVVIGIEDYDRLYDVPFAHRDAQAFANWLTYTRGIPITRVHLLTDESQEVVERQIKSTAGEVKSGGTLWIYFAGHGTAVPTGSGGQTERALVSRSAEIKTLYSDTQVLRLSKLQDMTRGTKAVDVVIVLDSCYSNATRNGGPISRDVDKMERPGVPLTALTPLAHTTIWSAAEAGSPAGAYKPAKHGRFTYLLVGGLRGWADGEVTGTPDGEVSSEELQAWMNRAMGPLSQYKQKMEMVGAPTKALTTGLPKHLDPPSLKRQGNPLIIAGTLGAAVGGALLAGGYAVEQATIEQANQGSLRPSQAESLRIQANGAYAAGYAFLIGGVGTVAAGVAHPTGAQVGWTWAW